MISRQALWSGLRQRRSLVVGSIVAVLAVAGIVDSSISRPAPPVVVAPPEATPLNANSSAWYCAMTPSTRATPANGLITIANVGSDAVTGTATVIPTSGESVVVPVGLARAERAVIRLGDLVDAPFSATTVQLNGAGVVVEHTAIVGSSNSTARCATTASDTWYFAEGSTASNASMSLALFNPFPEDAFADLAFVTSEDRATPPQLQGVVLAPQTLTVIDVGQYLKRREWIATKVTTRSGRLVVDQLQVNGAFDVKGASLALASPDLSGNWFVPNGFVGPNISDQLSFYNPNLEEASVEVRILPETPVAPSFTVVIPAEGRVAVRMGVDQLVPEGGRYSASIRSLGGQQIAVGRLSVATGAGSESPSGLSLSAAAPEAGPQWALGVGATVNPFDESVWVANFGDRPANVTLTASGSGTPSPLAPIVVEPGSRMEIPLDEQRITSVSDAALLLQSDEPVVVGRDIRRRGGGSFQSNVATLVR